MKRSYPMTHIYILKAALFKNIPDDYEAIHSCVIKGIMLTKG